MNMHWHQDTFQKLIQSHRSDRLPHGILLHGKKGIGKNQFARSFARWLICEQNNQQDTACGQCRSCQLFQGESYPDYFELFPEDTGKAIKVDQVRELIEKISLTGHGAGYRVVLISPADAMNINAANSLLKSLEEPPQRTIFILVTDRPSQLLATIRSRTQQIKLAEPAEEESINWLQLQGVDNAELLLNLAGGSPLVALSLAGEDALAIRQNHYKKWEKLASGNEDALNFSANWLKDSLKISPELPLNWIHSWVLDMIRLTQGIGPSYLVNVDLVDSLQNLARQVDLRSLYNLLDRVNDTFRLINGPANQQALIEGIMLHWSGMKRS